MDDFETHPIGTQDRIGQTTRYYPRAGTAFQLLPQLQPARD